MLTNLNPFVRFAGAVSADICPDKPYSVADSRLFLCRGGDARLKLSGKEYKVTEGTLVYIPPYSLYGFSGFSSDEDFVMIAVNFDFDQSRSHLKKTLAKLPDTETAVRESLYIPEPFTSEMIIPDGSFAREELEEMESLFFTKEQYYRDMSSGYMKCVLMKLLGVQRRAVDSPASRVISFIEGNCSRRLSNGEIAKELGYHPNHLNRIVKAHTGKTLKDYILYYRIKVAKRLLASTSLTVTEISEECGFSAPSYFSEIFTRSEGISPREYRRRLRSSVI